MDVERLLPADALRPRWSSASSLVYLGGFVILVATAALLGILGDEHGDWALVGYSVLATAVALSFAAAGLVIVLLGLVEDSVTALRRR